jgi:hypothetical protein
MGYDALLEPAPRETPRLNPGHVIGAQSITMKEFRCKTTLASVGNELAGHVAERGRAGSASVSMTDCGSRA